MSLTFLGALANVFYRDVRHFITLALFLGMFLSPVAYPLEKVPANWTGRLAGYDMFFGLSPRDLYCLNPMAGILQSYREALLYGSFDGALLIYPAVFGMVALLISYSLFKRFETRFAEVI